ncbi:[citrate (pro-3S)-lyase] ligase [Brenneria tiliae]|uniref:[Citrate [pro-3S]-lyase] ligase n=1 Tax=Brenneria tiliae TaxID=2914984 RepID=A0ABT0MPQ7_9GAMM|nr:[citrate (pro-3S)-lyase] ligase [Brenneria tiliae]MCL2891833.1 [citrate (pro-3S)-lyase] ligase [Brenneria tiliae]
MDNNIFFSRVKISENRKIAEVIKFLRQNDLQMDITIDDFITVTRNDRLIACGGISDNIIKCVAISKSVRGEGLALKLATELINLAYERHHRHLFIYTKPQNESLFKHCGFHTIIDVPDTVVLMENSANGLKRYASSLTALRRPGKRIGSIIMNANPFTNGHLYLVQKAVKQCDWLHIFLVKENTSRFPYEDRLQLVRRSTADIANLTVHPGSDYLISRATFPCYFIKDKGVADHCHTEIDLKIFRQYLAPALGITHRFVGSEPFCHVTAKYNQDMRYWLATTSLPSPPIVVMEIERLCYHGTPISASGVRKLLVKKDIKAIAPLVPRATRDYLQRMLAANAAAASSSKKTVLESGEK